MYGFLSLTEGNIVSEIFLVSLENVQKIWWPIVKILTIYLRKIQNVSIGQCASFSENSTVYDKTSRWLQRLHFFYMISFLRHYEIIWVYISSGCDDIPWSENVTYKYYKLNRNGPNPLFFLKSWPDGLDRNYSGWIW